MSAVTHLHGMPPRMAGPASDRRPWLRLVPTGPSVAGRRRSGLVLTRRGRLALCVLVMVAAVSVLTVGAQAFASGAAPVSTVTVSAGQTLSDVAHEALPSWPVGEAVARIQVLNDLNSLQVNAGQTLQIPR